ncbi:sensor histidine kinase [Rhodocytophaga rosea]|uniref:Sensor histidine kinase n=1 Tax=Rhodocytophaga rosea TaxID=2704465 RepID=A0A6C0GFS0_9BACT|nr:histidine kinase [Rhodocytophaga rosea]QHT66674.1 sensor histidine kinase [Rhodocytophaga rosea]
MQSFVQRNRVVLLHVSFWCVYLSFFIFQISRFEFTWQRIATTTSLAMTSTILIAYLNYFLLLPRFLAGKNVWKYLLGFLAVFMFFIASRLYLERWLIDGYTYQEKYLYTPRFIVQISAVALFIAIFVAMLRFAEQWFELEARKKEVENEKLMAELNFLKAQINPHFLFNTLNNLYYLAFTQSPNTTEVIAKLSQMMRYMIYDSNHPKVMLSKEIEYMQNYISLEKLRLNNQIPICFKIEGSPDQILIAPLIFITFLENAFKHGVSNNQSGSWVKISICINGKECVYKVENSKISSNGQAHTGKSGIGLQNVQRRLALSYPGKYELKTNDLPDRYSIQLNLLLN